MITNKRLLSVQVLCVIAVFSLNALFIAASAAEESTPIVEQEAPVERIYPKEPADALKTFSVLDGLRMDRIAQEPLVHDPIAFTYDENGAMYVVEMTAFPKPENAKEEAFGQVRMLLDDDGDGDFDSSFLFAEQLSTPTSVLCYKGGVFVTAPPNMWYMKDTDGDHRADIHEKVCTGFAMTHVEKLVNHLIWGVDNKIYGATSDSGGTIRPAEDPDAEPMDLTGHDFRFDPATGDFELLTRALNQWGHSFDDAYNRFVCRNIYPARHMVLPRRYVARNPNLRVETFHKSLAKEGGDEPVFRISPPEPWRVVRTRRRQKLGKPANPGEINAVGYFTASSSITVYRGNAYPKKYYGSLFIGEPAGNLIHRRTLTPSGVTFDSERADEKVEVVASTDLFFRPVSFVNAPDGTLHVADMYREVVEGANWVPKELQDQGIVDMTGGSDRGRIYRLSPPNFQVPKTPRLRKASSSDLVKQLENPNSWWRENAQRLLVERQDKTAVGPLRELLTTSDSSLARLHSLWTLHGLDALRDEELHHALTDRSAMVREHAIRAAEPRLNQSPQLLDCVLALSDDENIRIRFQVAFTLGGVADSRVIEHLIQIALHDIEDTWMQTAVLSSTSDVADRLIETLLQTPSILKSQAGISFLKELIFAVGVREQPGEIERVISAIADSSATRSTPRLQSGLLVQLADGLRRSGNDLLSVHQNDESSKINNLFSVLLPYARKAAADPGASPIDREEAIALLAFDDFSGVQEILPEMLDTTEPREVQLAAVRTLTRFSRSEVASILLGKLAGATPLVKSEIVEALMGRTEWIGQLLDAIENKNIPAGQIGVTRRNMLLDHRDPSIRSVAVKVFADEALGARQDVIDQYAPALKLSGDLDRGLAVFVRECTICHRLGEKGHDVGPNLSAYGRKKVPPETLMSHILDPNREVAADYLSYVLVLNDGRVTTGLIASQTPSTITLKRDQNVQEIIFRKNIDEIKSTGKSLMPEGFEKKITHQEMADLLEFLILVLKED